MDVLKVLGFLHPLVVAQQPTYSRDWDAYVATVILPDGAEAVVIAHSLNGPWRLVVPFVRDYPGSEVPLK